MKKIIMLIGLMLFFVSGLFAQAGETYYYKYVETVDKETGVRKKNNNDGIYYTFTKNACYQSDEKGIAKDNYAYYIFYYRGEKNNLYVFSSSNGLFYIYFSKDYKRLNEDYTYFVCVYEKADPPKKGRDTPDSLY